MNKGQQLWRKAKKIIPGGSQLLSKRSERFLPDLWPAYYRKVRGCEVWAYDGRHYFDFAQMGVGSCALGYADKDVNCAVIDAINNGSMCSLNSPEEIELAKMLIELHPWAKMVRFARAGGEACTIAVRIARAATGRNKVAFCGYHGWHDWYLSANIGNLANLDGQLLPGLDPLGVPRELKETALPFEYNNLESLERLVAKYGRQIGVIIMEPRRTLEPKKGFLEGVRRIADKLGAVLIFDEVTSGFRMNLGGIHLVLGVNPDIAVFGKALGNGFPISAIVGRREIMDFAQRTFISSTFWTERIGFAAAIATIKKMKKYNVQKYLIDYGNLIDKGWKNLADKHNIDIQISGIPSLIHISFKDDSSLALQTLYTQEMLKRGYLVSSSVYTTFAYNPNIIRNFISESDYAFRKIKKALDSGDVKRFLKGNVIQMGFKRLV